MTATRNYLAIDLGAESGRAILGRFDGERLALEEVHRFANAPVRLNDGLHWDALRLWADIKTGIGKAGRASGGDLAGVGLDAWGVDFALLDAQGALLANPFHHRDSRTDGALEAAFTRVGKNEIFAQTGIQFMQINSLYQLLAMALAQDPTLSLARTFLTMPDLFNYWLTGRKACEFTNATTTQCYDPTRRTWAEPLLSALGISAAIFPEIMPPGSKLGSLLPAVAAECGIDAIPVIAPACHDTGSAVAAIPVTIEDYAWISSGTWSVLGAVVPEAVINEQSMAFNFTNEGGLGGTFRLCKNIMGLWLVQECRRTWAGQGEEYSYDDLVQMGAAATPFRCVIDIDDPAFLSPGDMPARIRAYATNTGQTSPQSKGEIIRCVLEGIALKYRFQFERLQTLLAKRLDVIHIVGGGSRNWLLSQWTADACNRPVVTGPVEATAMGNLLVQASALGDVASLAEARGVVLRSGEVETFEPRKEGGWEEAFIRLQALLQN
ncbi:MAG: rhamnulokinase [Caldilineales bacterium]|nr:rhamnulokinase [Caldilineales bacterium]